MGANFKRGIVWKRVGDGSKFTLVKRRVSFIGKGAGGTTSALAFLAHPPPSKFRGAKDFCNLNGAGVFRAEFATSFLKLDN